MRTLARILCLSAFVLAPAARIGADDDEHVPSLFDQVREGIKKLKPEMEVGEAMRILQVAKMKRSSPYSVDGGGVGLDCTLPGKLNQWLSIRAKRQSSDLMVWSVQLCEGDKIVAQFDGRSK